MTFSAQTYDSKVFQLTLENIILKKPAGLHHIYANKAFDSAAIRQLAKDSNYRSHIKSRGDERKEKLKNPTKKARRWVVERTHSWINKFRSYLFAGKRNQKTTMLACILYVPLLPLKLLEFSDRLLVSFKKYKILIFKILLTTTP